MPAEQVRVKLADLAEPEVLTLVTSTEGQAVQLRPALAYPGREVADRPVPVVQVAPEQLLPLEVRQVPGRIRVLSEVLAVAHYLPVAMVMHQGPEVAEAVQVVRSTTAVERVPQDR